LGAGAPLAGDLRRSLRQPGDQRERCRPGRPGHPRAVDRRRERPPARRRDLLCGGPTRRTRRRREQLGAPRDRGARGLGSRSARRRRRHSGRDRGVMAIDERLTEEVSPAAPARPMAGARSLTMHAGLLAATLLSATLAGVDVEPRELVANPALFLRGLPFAAALVTILLVHELGHYLTCLRYRVSASLPYFLPAPLLSPVGTFGAFIRIRSRFPDRRALFDIGASGPWAGFVVALAATVIGLTHSTVLATPQEWHGFACGDSLLTAFLTRIVLHVDSAVVVLHPVAFAGWFGLFVTSLNLLPVGQLDGRSEERRVGKEWRSRWSRKQQ